MKKVICFVLPTYLETESVFNLILELHKNVPSNSRIVVVDDSPGIETIRMVQSAFVTCGWNPENTHVIHSGQKSGRGLAVKRGFEYALSDSEITCFVEMDSDGSHSAQMAMRVSSQVPENDFCIGSRYLSESEIVGWSFQRRVFSRAINRTLRWIFTREISDWTNGLRAYSRPATQTLLARKSLTSGFIYLSEQAVILTKVGFTFCQIPIIFQNRTHGESTVTWREIWNSVSGLAKIVKNKRFFEDS